MSTAALAPDLAAGSTKDSPEPDVHKRQFSADVKPRMTATAAGGPRLYQIGCPLLIIYSRGEEKRFGSAAAADQLSTDHECPVTRCRNRCS